MAETTKNTITLEIFLITTFLFYAIFSALISTFSPFLLKLIYKLILYLNICLRLFYIIF